MRLLFVILSALCAVALRGQDALTIVANDTTLPVSLVGEGYPATVLNATGGRPPYRWAVEGTSLPDGLTLSEVGVLAGLPNFGFCCFLKLLVTDSANAVARATVSFSILPALSANSPNAVKEFAYEPGQVFLHSYTNRGAPPYDCTVRQGTLPPGVFISPGCLLGGVLQKSGEFSYTLRITSSDNASFDAATRVLVPLRISPQELPDAELGRPFSQTLTPQFGSGPYRFDIEDGALPDGLALTSAGDLSGTPRFFGATIFRLRVTDAARTQRSQTYRFYTKFPPLPPVLYQFTNTGVGQVASVMLGLASPYPVDLNGVLTVEFLAETGLPADDPTIQLNNSRRIVGFTLPAGSTTASFTGGPPTFDTGSIAGDIFVSTVYLAEGYDVTPILTPYWLVRLPRAVPVIRSLSAARSSTGLDLAINGFSNTRELTLAAIRFTAATGASLQQADFTVPLIQGAAAFYSSAASLAYGGQFSIMLPVTISSGSSAVSSVSVTLTNSIGNSVNSTVEMK